MESGHGPVPTLRGPVVFLDGFRAEDAAAHVAGEDEETARRFGWWPKRSTVEGVLRTYADWDAEWRHGGPRRTFAARDSATGELVGGCELQIRPDGSANVSYWTHASRRCKGYARHALLLLCDYAASVEVTPLEAHVAVDNLASRRTCESCGFTADGEMTEEGERRVRYVRAISCMAKQSLSRRKSHAPSWR
ncbi:MAG TPA: GNAT family protein [Trebonia sp.]|jgi:RimJ/RimL family protein N-acetyltransferase|nr:GNAT family protein [Trebonia sp.]